MAFRNTDQDFDVGAEVEYYSESTKQWIPATMLKKRGDGKSNLDCKTNAPSNAMRKPTPSARRSELVEAAALRGSPPVVAAALRGTGAGDVSALPAL